MIDMLETAEVVCQIFAAVIFVSVVGALLYAFAF